MKQQVSIAAPMRLQLQLLSRQRPSLLINRAYFCNLRHSRVTFLHLRHHVSAAAARTAAHDRNSLGRGIKQAFRHQPQKSYHNVVIPFARACTASPCTRSPCTRSPCTRSPCAASGRRHRSMGAEDGCRVAEGVLLQRGNKGFVVGLTGEAALSHVTITEWHIGGAFCQPCRHLIIAPPCVARRVLAASSGVCC